MHPGRCCLVTTQPRGCGCRGDARGQALMPRVRRRYYPVGGPQVITKGLIAAIERSGGAVLVRARVDAIVVDGGRAVGVQVMCYVP